LKKGAIRHDEVGRNPKFHLEKGKKGGVVPKQRKKRNAQGKEICQKKRAVS